MNALKFVWADKKFPTTSKKADVKKKILFQIERVKYIVKYMCR